MTSNLRPKLLAVTNDLATLRSIAEITAPYFETIRVRDAAMALSLIETDKGIGAMVSEHLPIVGTENTLLDLVRIRKPHIKRIMLTTYTDLSVIVHGLHTGSIQHVIHKPVNRAELLTVVGIPTPVSTPGGVQNASARLSV